MAVRDSKIKFGKCCDCGAAVPVTKRGWCSPHITSNRMYCRGTAQFAGEPQEIVAKKGKG